LIGIITDNGIGRQKSEVLKNQRVRKHKSWAMHIMQDRIKYSNILHTERIAIKVIDLEENGKALGTSVILSIKPLWDEI